MVGRWVPSSTAPGRDRPRRVSNLARPAEPEFFLPGARMGVGVDSERESPWTRTPLTIWQND